MAFVDFSVRQSCAIVTLNRPDRRNTLTAEMCQELVRVTAKIEQDDNISTMIVTGAGPAFCAGAELGDLLSAGKGDSDKLQQIYAGFLAIANCKLPTIAVINGPAIGAGMNLALACDVRIVAESARLDTRFLKIGIHPGGGHTWMLHREVNWQTSAAILLFGEVLSAEDSVRLGLAWRCVANSDLMDTALAFALNAANTPRELLIRTKSSMRDTRWLQLQQDALSLEYTQQAWSLQQPEAAASLQAMYDKIRQ